MIKIETIDGVDHYIVAIPEHGIRQDINPDTRQPFVSESEAQVWQDATLAAIEQHLSAAEKAVEAAEQERLATLIHLEITADKTEVSIGQTIAVTATLKNGHGDTVPLDQTFAVPIQGDAGSVAKVKGVVLVKGIASISLAFDKSGYYRITETGINQRLEGMYIHMPQPFEVTVFE